MTTAYADFLASKNRHHAATGVDADLDLFHPAMFPFQTRLTEWALRKGRSALFASTGLGKTVMHLHWGLQAAERTLIVAPLAVAFQTVAEARDKWGISLAYARNEFESPLVGLTITNYERLDKFDPANYGAVVLDESSCLKDFTSKTRTQLIEMFRDTPMRLCCTATPAPNDIAEIANHAEFLGVMTRVEMLATFFVHDDNGWRLRKHARQDFYKWLATWAMTLVKPSDLGFSDEGYELPPLTVEPIILRSDYTPDGQLLATGLKGVGDRSRVRKGTLQDRVTRVLEIVNREPDQAWILWCGLNDESDALAKALPRAIVVTGSQDAEKKAELLALFGTEGGILVSKAAIAGMGLNYQHCARMIFVGMNDSWESWFQAIRRCWRFGQQNPVHVYAVLSDQEEPILHNVMKKEKQATEMTTELVKQVAEYERSEIGAVADPQSTPLVRREVIGKNWRLINGDSCEEVPNLPAESIDFSVYSPPFASLYVYSPTTRDLANCASRDQFFGHYRYVIEGVLRATKPGRLTAVHVQQLATTQSTHGVIGLYDFRGDVIRAYVDAGWIFHGESTIDQDPQAQAIRTHSKALLFVQLRKDSSWLRPAMADYILLFRKPGENAVEIKADLTNDDWIEWARPIWYNIRESDTLNIAEGRDSDDERHICALQLGTIERCIRLWSNKGETVLSPFAGIGSEGHEAIRLGRKFVGVELKRRYFDTALKNMARAEALAGTHDLFSLAGVDVDESVASGTL